MRSKFTPVPSGLLLAGCSLFATAIAPAEDMRVFTVVYDVSAAEEGEQPPVLARTVTLFHAGKVYDYIDSSDNSEVIVFEPTQRRFRILNPSLGVVTSAAFAEIKQKLSVAQEQTAREARILSSSDPAKESAAQWLSFQLSPMFETSYDDKTSVLELRSKPITYRVAAVHPEEEAIVDLYLDYADWVCRLNYVLTVGPILPSSRLAVNRALRSRHLLPESVELTTQTRPASHLRAEHTYHWSLTANEKAWIHQWESQLNSTTVREVTLQEYQRAVLSGGE